MTQKKDTPRFSTEPAETPAIEQRPRTADEVPAGTSGKGVALFWMLLTVGFIGGGLWALEKGYIDEWLGTPSQYPSLFLTEDPSHTTEAVAEAEAEEQAPAEAPYAFVEEIVVTEEKPFILPEIQPAEETVVDAPEIAETIEEVAPPAEPLPPAPVEAAAQPVETAEEYATREEIARLASSQASLDSEREQLLYDIKRMQTEMAALQESISKLAASQQEQKKQPTAITVTASPPDNRAVEALERQIVELTTRLDTLQQQHARQNSHYVSRLRLAHILDDISERVYAGAPFAEEVPQLRNAAGALRIDHRAIETLQLNAAQGVPSLAQLISQFTETAQTALPFSIGNKEKRSFTDNLRGNLAHVISIRRIEVPVEDNSDEAHMTRAEAELKVGNVEMALTHLEQLSPGPQTLFQQWMQQARQYREVHNAIAQLRAASLQGGDMELSAQ